MTPSSASEKPQVILVPRTQLTPDPVRGYTTVDFWRDLDDRRKRAAQELERFKQMIEGRPRPTT
jgi:hypothetical protein